MIFRRLTGAVLFLSLISFNPGQAQEATPQASRLLSNSIDVSKDFSDFTHLFFFADSLSSFNTATGEGSVAWKRETLFTRQAFNTNTILPFPAKMLDFPETGYEANPRLQFSIDFVSNHTVRLRMATSKIVPKEGEEVMLVQNPTDKQSWKYIKIKGGHKYQSPTGETLVIEEYPWRILLYDSKGKLLTSTRRWMDNDSTQVKVLPFCFIRRGDDNSRSINPVFSLSPNEKIVGCGESFTSLNKVGQKVNLFVTDPQGPETADMYKPIPFFMSSRGYGMFMHTSAPVTCDFGASYVGTTKLFMKDEALDLFLFWGEPQTILDEYTSLVGKTAMPPLWSFGTWMSRITYTTQQEGYDVAANLRKYRIPSDVIHFDTGWFETDWQCDYKFAPSRFKDPQKMIDDLLKQGFHISLWQLPYFTPKNKYYNEIIEQGLYVKNADGSLPYEDAVLDFSNPKTVSWYQDKLSGLLKMGVGAIKVDFGEGAPLEGFYASGKGGLYEHNIYPVRYNRAVAEVTKRIKGDNIIWARSAWAGSQRYPLHWGGDAANTNVAMLSDMRGGLSLGLSGFSFWSHDMGGFVLSSPENLYRRWLPFGFLSSHTRAHGAPPTEPWLYNESFVKIFRACAEMKYKLMPYVYAQAKDCTERGLPMLRALCVEYPEDVAVWSIDDQYLFGRDILVAPLFEDETERDVYLPGGKWIDYQSGKVYDKGWNKIAVGAIPAVILVRDGAVIPHIALAQSTDKMDWSKLFLRVYSTTGSNAHGLICLPSDNILHKVEMKKSGNAFSLTADPFQSKVKFEISSEVK
jgi:alpha-D-xyloside xylohydrolase